MVAEVLDGFAEVAKDEIVANGEFRMMNVFSVKTRSLPARTYRDVNTKEVIERPETTAIYSKLSNTIIKSYRDNLKSHK
jgi:nucleoid DNA-binding protein